MDEHRTDDRAGIETLTTAYAYAVDEQDWAAFEALFTPDAAIDYTESGGIAGTPAQVAAWMPEGLALFEWTMHSMSTRRITFTGPDAATGDVHVLARHGLSWEGQAELLDISAIYRDRYVRTADGWRFAARHEQLFAVDGGAFAALLRSTIGRAR